MRKLNVKPSARHATEATFRGSRDMIVAANGDLNAGSRQELMLRIAELSQMIADGEVFTDVSHAVTPDTHSNAREELAAAWEDKALWNEMGTAITSEIQERVLRDGFMRSLFERGEVASGSTPRIRVRTPNVRAIVSKGIGRCLPQWVYDRYIPVDEFRIDANVRIEELEMLQGSGEILEDKFYEAQEQILVKEDQVIIGLFRAATGVYNPATYFSGAFTPTILQGLRETISGWSLPVSTFLFANDILSDMMTGDDFSGYYDPITKYEIIQTGRVGSIFGLQMITDGYREPNLVVLRQGETFMVSNPNMLGAYTDRGPIKSTPVDEYAEGTPARGWAMTEYISAALANAKAVATASR